MIWICRAGISARYYDYYLDTSRIYLPWDGFCIDLSTVDTMEGFRQLVVSEKGTAARTSISNWAGQLNSFCNDMSVGDYVLIPYFRSKEYTFAKITGNYMFDPTNTEQLWHSREIEIIRTGISKSVFSQSLQYALGAFRTVFKLRTEKESELLTAVGEQIK